ncbi:MAG: tRNA uracil 4-sulfurtransferase ThiI [Pseudomonadota bacterium]
MTLEAQGGRCLFGHENFDRNSRIRAIVAHWGNRNVMTTAIILRYGEMFLKGKNRALFERQLQDNATRALAGVPGARATRLHGRALVLVEAEARASALERLRRLFGVSSLSPARLVVKDFEAISREAVDAAIEVSRAASRPPTFKVAVKRSDKSFTPTSPELCREIGARIIAATGMKVDVHQPELCIGIEIGIERTFVFSSTIAGPGGLPVGVSGKTNLLLSGGIDSPVAGWLAMKRGCSICATYFHSFPLTSDHAKEKVVDLARLLAAWQGELVLMVVDFTDAQKALRSAGPGELSVVLYRRMMMRVASRLAQRENALALVTGENLGQVASQTLENLGVIEDAALLPVLRPLVTNDKIETIALAKRIGTYDISIRPFEDCCSLFVPKHPAIRARLERVRDVETRLEIDSIADELAARAERRVVTSR